MTGWRSSRRLFGLAVVVVAAAVTAATVLLGSAASAAPQKIPYPASMAALGDSLTLAFTTPNRQVNSWSTGTTPSVRSHYLRILAANPAIKGKAYNLAEPGASFAEMQGQARRAVARHAQYVTVWGGEEWCWAPDLKGLTKELGGVLDILARGKPQPYVLVLSVRNPGTMYKLLQANRRDFPSGVTVGLCGLAVGAKPAQDSGAKVVAKAVASVKQINATIAQVCASHPRCRFDGNAVYAMPWRFSDLSSDYEHLTLAGQRHLAEVTWRATFPFGR